MLKKILEKFKPSQKNFTDTWVLNFEKNISDTPMFEFECLYQLDGSHHTYEQVCAVSNKGNVIFGRCEEFGNVAFIGLSSNDFCEGKIACFKYHDKKYIFFTHSTDAAKTSSDYTIFFALTDDIRELKKTKYYDGDASRI